MQEQMLPDSPPYSSCSTAAPQKDEDQPQKLQFSPICGATGEPYKHRHRSNTLLKVYKIISLLYTAEFLTLGKAGGEKQ